MNKSTLSVLLVAVIVGVAAFMAGKYLNNSDTNIDIDQPSNGDNYSTPDSNGDNGGSDVPQKASNDFIKVDSPTINQVITSPLQVSGEARGNWYFEANLPMRLEDANGNVIARGFNMAQGEWMTTNFVPFKGTLTFQAPQTATGYLVIEKDNPSGLPENDAEIKVPIRFR